MRRPHPDPRFALIASSFGLGIALLDVRDNGRGISPEDHETIFSKFHQVGDTLTDKPHGSGLGLHISRQIVEHFGGRMWVESNPGSGARFSFTLPTGART